MYTNDNETEEGKVLNKHEQNHPKPAFYDKPEFGPDFDLEKERPKKKLKKDSRIFNLALRDVIRDSLRKSPYVKSPMQMSVSTDKLNLVDDELASNEINNNKCQINQTDHENTDEATKRDDKMIREESVNFKRKNNKHESGNESTDESEDESVNLKRFNKRLTSHECEIDID